MAEEYVESTEVLDEEDKRKLDEDLKALGEQVAEEPAVEPEVLSSEEIEDKKDDELHADKTPEEREAIRERRRQERKQKVEHRKQKEDSYRREIEGLRKQLEEVNTWKNSVEKRDVQSGIAQLDKAINDSTEALNIAKQAIREATETQNGQALVDAQELYYAARKRGEDLGRVKQTIQQRLNQPQQRTLDQVVVNQAQNWMSSKPWYDVSGKDSDSRITQVVESGLTDEGWDPRQPEYWSELDNRLQKYLPHRFNMSYTSSTSSTRGEKPKPPTESSSPGTGVQSTGYRLSPERVKAMKEAGMWDDPSKRQAMVKRYVELDKQSRK